MTSLHQPAIAELLSAGWLQTVRWYEVVDSTSDAARRSLNEHDPVSLPALFVADQQSAGRGRNQRVWWSPSGCLMQTLVISHSELPMEPATWPQLALVCGVAVAHAASRFVESSAVQLKWPNDVYLYGKKLAGILIESASSRAGQAHTTKLSPDWMIGIGCNVDVDWSSAPADVAGKATCINSHAITLVSSDLVLIELMEELREQLAAWRDRQTAWLDSWQDRCLLSGREVVVRLGPSQISGRCEGIDTHGRLIIRTPTGVQLLSAGEVLAWF